MAAVFGLQRDSLEVEVTGTTTTVPNNSLARLMYYLKCVRSCLPSLDIPDRLCNYNNYFYMSNDDSKTVVAYAVLLSPDVLNNEVFFPVSDSYMGKRKICLLRW